MSLQHLVLGVLKYGALSGYDLRKAFEASVQHFWATDQSQIYRALYKLHEAGFVEVEVVEQDGAPDKKIYSLTDAGKDELRRWLASPILMPSLHEGWLGQLFFAVDLEPAEIRRLLEARITEIEGILDRYEKDAPAAAAHYVAEFDAAEDARFWLLTLDYGIQRMRFDLQWAQTALALFQQSTDQTFDSSTDEQASS